MSIPVTRSRASPARRGAASGGGSSAIQISRKTSVNTDSTITRTDCSTSSGLTAVISPARNATPRSRPMRRASAHVRRGIASPASSDSSCPARNDPPASGVSTEIAHG